MRRRPGVHGGQPGPQLIPGRVAARVVDLATGLGVPDPVVAGGRVVTAPHIELHEPHPPSSWWVIDPRVPDTLPEQDAIADRR